MALTGATHHRLEHGGEPSPIFGGGCRTRPWILCATSFWAQQRSRRGLRNDWSGEVHGWWTFRIGLLAQLPRSRVRQLLFVRAMHLGLAAIAGEPWTSRCRERRQIHGCRSEALGALALGRAGETGLGWR